MKRIISLILAGLLLASVSVSCAETEAEPEETTNANEPAAEEVPETEQSYIDSLGEKNFDGASFVVAASQQGSIPAFAREQTGEVVNDALYERDLTISDAYNVVIEYPETPDSPDTANDIANSVLAGDFYCDLYIDALSNGRTYMSGAFTKGALYNLLDVPHLQLDQSWWSELLYDKLQYKGKMYFTSGDVATASYNSPACVFMNLTTAQNQNIAVEEIYQLVYEGAWTIDEVTKRTAGLRVDLNGDGEVKVVDDSFGIISATVELTATEICVGAGVKYCDIDENGNLVVNLNTEQVINTLEKLKQCFNEIQPGDDWSPMTDTFKNDRALFLVHFVETAIKLRDMESDFVILPMAKYSVEQESYMSYTNPHAHSYVAIPLIQPDIERTGFITEVMEYLSVQSVRPTIYDVTLKGKVSRNPDSQAMLDIIFNTSYIDFNALNNFGSSTQLMCDALFNGADFVSSYKRNQKIMDKTLGSFEELFQESAE